jgi:DMSO/TMAO reductase YedYZ heme-binding membrane subunit
MKNLYDHILLAIAIALFIIAIHQTLVYDFMHSYWLYLMVFTVVLIMRLRRLTAARQAANQATTPNKTTKNTKAAKRKS